MRRTLPRALRMKQGLRGNRQNVSLSKNNDSDSSTKSKLDNSESKTVESKTVESKEIGSKTVDHKEIVLDTQKVAVCCCGFAPRSLKYTYESIQKNIIDKLLEDFEVDTFVYSLTSKSGKIQSSKKKENGVSVNNDDSNLLGGTIFTQNQETIDNPQVSSLLKDRTEIKDINMVRSLFMEQQSYELMMKHAQKLNIKYSAIVYVHPDMFISKPIKLSEVYKVIQHHSAVYTCNFNDWNGYGVGYYIGCPAAIKSITSRINLVDDTKISREKLLQKSFEAAKLKRYPSSMFHFKVRSDGGPDVFYQLLKKYVSSDEYMATKLAYNTKISQATKNKIKDKLGSDDSNVSTTLRHSRSRARKHKRRSCPN